MIRAIVVAVVWTAAIAHAEPPSPPAEPPSDSIEAHLARARDLHDRGDFVHARDELVAAYQLEPRPELLFALGQIEFNLHHYSAAIDYYERFNATNPSAEQAALAEQAIGAARTELLRPAPTPPAVRLPPHRRWDLVDSSLLAFGGLATAAGGGLLYEMRHLANDHAGSLATYDTRISKARTARLAAAGSFAAGAIAVSAALLRWRFHLVDTEIEIHATPGGAGVTVMRSL